MRHQLVFTEDNHETGCLTFRDTWLTRKVTSRGSVVSILPWFATERRAVEDFIRNVYADAYGARINVHYPVLMSLRNEAGDILAALGFRPAAEGDLFLEQYTGAPIDALLGGAREKIVEIGNLASAGGGASLFLFAAMAAYLAGNGMSHAVVTSTDFLEKRFVKMGLKPERICKADPSMLLHDDEDWGSYYGADPRVLAGRVDLGYRRLQSLLGAVYTVEDPRVYTRLHHRVDCGLDGEGI